MTEPDDRELEQYLAGDGKLSRSYREASRESAPPELDEAILAQARAELKRKPPSLNRVLAPVALAASVVLGVNLAWNLHQAEPVPADLRQPQTKAQSRDDAFVPPPPAAPAPVREEKRAAEADALQRRDAEVSQQREQEALRKQKSEERLASSARRAEAPPPGPQSQSLAADEPAAGAAASQPQAMADAAAPGATNDASERVARKASDPHGSLPAGWSLPGAADRYDASIDESVYQSAPNSLVMWRTAPGTDGCGRLQTEAPAADFLGREVRVKASVRTQGVQGMNVLLFVSYARGGYMQSPITVRVPAAEGAWRMHDESTVIPDNADRVAYGAMLCGPGTLWLDDIVLSRAAQPGNGAAQAKVAPMAESAKIDRLIAHVGGLQGAVFIRNGKEHGPAEAAKHLQRKRDGAGERCDTAEEFIRVCASFSSKSGEAYLIRFTDGRTRTAEDVLREELARIER